MPIAFRPEPLRSSLRRLSTALAGATALLALAGGAALANDDDKRAVTDPTLPSADTTETAQ